MKRVISIFTIILCTLPMWVQAQDINVKPDTIRALKKYKGTDNWFIGVHGGFNHSISENARHGKFWDMTKPSFAISAGKYFSPALGVRLQFGYHQQQSRANEEAVKYNPIINGRTLQPKQYFRPVQRECTSQLHRIPWSRLQLHKQLRQQGRGMEQRNNSRWSSR